MKIATISEAKNRLSALLHAVRKGETVLILDRKRPIARIERVMPSDGDAGSERLAELERTGVLSPAGGPLSAEFLKTVPPRPRQGASGVRLLLDERDHGR